MKDEYISVKEFAKRAGVSVQSLYKRLNGLNNPLNQYIKLVDNQKMLNISALEEIYGIEVEQPIQPNHSTYSTFHSTSESINEAVIDTLLKQTEILKKELEIKNIQIKELNERLSESQKLLAYQQQLQAMAEQKLQLLEQKEIQQEVKEKKRWQFWKSE